MTPDLEQALPVLETRTLARTQTGSEVVAASQPSRSEPLGEAAREGRGRARRQVDTDPSVARIWIKALWGSQAGKKGVA